MPPFDTKTETCALILILTPPVILKKSLQPEDSPLLMYFMGKSDRYWVSKNELPNEDLSQNIPMNQIICQNSNKDHWLIKKKSKDILRRTSTCSSLKNKKFKISSLNKVHKSSSRNQVNHKIRKFNCESSMITVRTGSHFFLFLHQLFPSCYRNHKAINCPNEYTDLLQLECYFWKAY